MLSLPIEEARRFVEVFKNTELKRQVNSKLSTIFQDFFRLIFL
jgi:hypothetical protein